MSDGREYTPPRSSDGYWRRMMRCAVCRRWWSVGPENDPRCGCGGDLAEVDMEAHMASVPAPEPGK